MRVVRRMLIQDNSKPAVKSRSKKRWWQTYLKNDKYLGFALTKKVNFYFGLIFLCLSVLFYFLDMPVIFLLLPFLVCGFFFFKNNVIAGFLSLGAVFGIELLSFLIERFFGRWFHLSPGIPTSLIVAQCFVFIFLTFFSNQVYVYGAVKKLAQLMKKDSPKVNQNTLDQLGKNSPEKLIIFLVVLFLVYIIVGMIQVFLFAVMMKGLVDFTQSFPG